MPALPDTWRALSRILLGEPEFTGPEVADVGACEDALVGPTVNLASRLVNIARAGTVLVSDALAARLQHAGAFTLRSLRPLRLKGIGRTHVWVLRPAREHP